VTTNPTERETTADALAEAGDVLRAMAEHGIRVDDRKFERYTTTVLAALDERGREREAARAEVKRLRRHVRAGREVVRAYRASEERIRDTDLAVALDVYSHLHGPTAETT
jgi:hypothetical protein